MTIACKSPRFRESRRGKHASGLLRWIVGPIGGLAGFLKDVEPLVAAMLDPPFGWTYDENWQPKPFTIGCGGGGFGAL